MVVMVVTAGAADAPADAPADAAGDTLAPTSRGRARPTLDALGTVGTLGREADAGLTPGWLAPAGVVVLGTIGTFGLVTALRSRGRGWVLRPGAAGVTVRDRATVPREDVAEVTIQLLQPDRLFSPRFSGLPRGASRWPVVAVVPRPGVTIRSSS